MSYSIKIKVNSEQAVITLNLNGKQFTEVHKVEWYGTTLFSGNFAEEKEIPDDLYVALSDAVQGATDCLWKFSELEKNEAESE